MSKSYNGLVSRFLDPSNRAWETVVYQAGKPILDSEQNLIQDNASAELYSVLKTKVHSGWVRGDFFDYQSDFQFYQPLTSLSNANKFRLTNYPIALVDGALIRVEYTGTNISGENVIDLGAPPTTGVRADLVFLEVWRTLLSAAPSMTNKSLGGRIWRNGNVLVAAVDDATLNFADDIKDPTPNAETTKRVQLQYRVRVVQGIAYDSFPQGINDSNVFAFGASGSATTFQFTNMGSVTGDYGLWRAGDGSSSNTLTTVDGYSYAIPIGVVFRRNTDGFRQIDNHNGGVLYPTSSDRPDRQFANSVFDGDMVDLRHGVALNNYDYEETLEKNFSDLLDNELNTVEQNTQSIPGYTQGSRGNKVLQCDVLGNQTGLGGTTIGKYDTVRRRFSDRSVIEHPIIIREPSASVWADGEEIDIDLAAFDAYPHGAIDVGGLAPTNTYITNILTAYWDGPTGGSIGKTSVPITELRGLGTDHIVMKIGTVPSGITSHNMWIEVEVTYPSGNGMTFTPYADFGSTGVQDSDVGHRPADFNAFSDIAFVHWNREAQILYQSVNQTILVISTNTTTVVLPERIDSVVSVTELPATTKSFSFLRNDPARTITITGAPFSGNAVQVQIVYKAIRPWQDIANYWHSIFYQSRAIQAVKASLLPAQLAYRAIHASPFMYALTAGTGSPGAAYPYEMATTQLPANDSIGFTGEEDLDSPLDTFVDDFDASSGFLRVLQAIPFVPVEGTLQTIATDVEQRSFYTTAPSDEYKPAAFGKNLSFAQRHKVFFPVLAELTQDYTFAPKHSLVMLIFTRWANFDNENNVRFVASNNTSCAAVYRINGNLLMPRRNG